jgi:toxin FitB
MNVVDSSAWLAYFADEPTADYFAVAIEDTELLLVPSVCIYEVFKVMLREKGNEGALLAVATMQLGLVIDLGRDQAVEAATLSVDEGLALADSIIYATARNMNATLWTQDKHFMGKQNVQYKEKGSS